MTLGGIWSLAHSYELDVIDHSTCALTHACRTAQAILIVLTR
jgi:hypothetical protein